MGKAIEPEPMAVRIDHATTSIKTGGPWTIRANANHRSREVVRAITARSSSFRTEPGSGADRAGGPLLLPTIRRPQAGSGNRPIEEGAVAPFRRGTPRPTRPPALRAPLDSRPPRSGGLRRRSDEPPAAATASRRPTDRRRPPPLLRSPGPVGALAGTNGRGQRQMDSRSAPGPCRFPGRCRRRDLGDRCLGAAPFSRTGAHRSWLWQLPSPRAWARPLSAQPRATGTAGSSDRDRRTLRPWPQSARSGGGSGSRRKNARSRRREHRLPPQDLTVRRPTVRFLPSAQSEDSRNVWFADAEGAALIAEGNRALTRSRSSRPCVPTTPERAEGWPTQGLSGSIAHRIWIVTGLSETESDELLEGLSGSEHEDIVIVRRARSGLRAIIAVHSTLLGPSLGGARFYPYEDEAVALDDVLRLSRAMTEKAALAGLAQGGGKAVIIGDPNLVKTPDLLRDFAAAVNSLEWALRHRRGRRDDPGRHGSNSGDDALRRGHGHIARRIWRSQLSDCSRGGGCDGGRGRSPVGR